jgi:hypothetical protein
LSAPQLFEEVRNLIKIVLMHQNWKNESENQENWGKK